MIIPIRCFTCGNIIANKGKYFEKRKEELSANLDKIDTDKDGYYQLKLGEVLDELGLKRICCRRHLLCHRDLIKEI